MPAPSTSPSTDPRQRLARGRALLAGGRAGAALAEGEALLGEVGPWAPAHRLCAEALYRQRRIPSAEFHLARALALGERPEALAQTRWMCAMLRGDFEAAWRIGDAVLEARAGRDCSTLPRHLRWVWNGRALAGGRLLLRCYHGLGDTLQFIRFAPLLRRICPFLAVEAQAELLPLLAGAAGIDRLLPLGAAPPRSDHAVESTELPHALRLRLAEIPAAVPYLAVPPERIAEARPLALAAGGRLKVGIAWAAGAWRPERSVPAELMAALGAVPGVALFNLQRGPALAALATGGGPHFAARGPESNDILETAALIAHLDLIVTVDTMVAHLAGALGRPVWTLLHFEADWRWMLDRADTPWYPTMRLFRQPAPGAWRPVIASVAAELARTRPSPRGRLRHGGS